MRLSRSEQMSRIRGSRTRPELALFKRLQVGRRHAAIGRIKPDLVVRRPGLQLALFIDGCFWHGCPHHYVAPRSSRDFWSRKLAENVERDSRQTKFLQQNDWLVVRVWEHEVAEDLERAAQKVERALQLARYQTERWRVVAVDIQPDGSELRTLRKLVKPECWRVERSPRLTAKTGRVKRERVGEGIDHVRR